MIPGAPLRYSMTRHAGRVHRRTDACGEVGDDQVDACVPVAIVDPTDVEQTRRILGRVYGMDPDRVPVVEVAAWQAALELEATS